MSEIVEQSLQKIVKGTGIVFLGMVGGMALAFLGRVLMARYFTPSEYGVFSLAFTVLILLSALSTVGLQQGSTRQIAYYRGKNDTAKVQGVVTSSLQIALAASVLFSVILLLTSGIISTKIFHEPGLVTSLKTVSIAIPFLTLIFIFTFIFRGFDEVKPRAYFHDVLRCGLFPLLLVPIILLDLSFFWAMCALSASIILTCILFVIYSAKRGPFSVGRERYLVLNPAARELLRFSLPLFVVMLLNQIMMSTDTIMLGYFGSLAGVGLYNSALPLSRGINLSASSAIFIFGPVITGLYAEELMSEMKRTYQLITKWLFYMILPLFLLLVMFPGTILNFFFGNEYVEASVALQILALGFFIYACFSPVIMMLIAMGETKFLLYTTLTGATVNIVLNVVLIPLWGIIGAAAATVVSWNAAVLLNSAGLYKFAGIHPFTWKLLKPIPGIAVAAGLVWILSRVLVVRWWMLPLFLLFFLATYILSLLLTRSLEDEDINLLLAIEKRMGLNMAPIKRVLKKFI